MPTIRELSGNVDPRTLYCDTPSAAFLGAALTIPKGAYGIMYGIVAGADDEAVVAKVTECDTVGGTYTDITGATFALDDTLTGSSRLYTCFVKSNQEFQKVSVSSTPTGGLEYVVFALIHGQKEVPV